MQKAKLSNFKKLFVTFQARSRMNICNMKNLIKSGAFEHKPCSQQQKQLHNDRRKN